MASQQEKDHENSNRLGTQYVNIPSRLFSFTVAIAAVLQARHDDVVKLRPFSHEGVDGPLHGGQQFGGCSQMTCVQRVQHARFAVERVVSFELLSA